MNRSITILPTFLFIALALTVMYALLGLRGPEAVLREARYALDREQYKKSIKLLKEAENALDDNRSGLLEQSLRMRVAAYEQLNFRDKVIEDIETLFDRLGVRDRDLMCTRIRMHNELAAELQDHASLRRARELARMWLTDHQADALILAQAGNSTNLEATWLFDKWVAAVRLTTPPDEHKRLEKLMATAVYSASATQIRENQVRTLTIELEKLVAGSTDDAIAMIDRIRDVALRARDFFLRSLSHDNLHPAYRGLAEQLRSAGDDDTLLMIAHSFLSRASTRNGMIAAVDIADIHLRHRRLQAVIKIADRTLPRGKLRSDYLIGKLNHHAIRLILCRALAANTLGNRAQSRELLADFTALMNNQEQKLVQTLHAAPLQYLIFALLLEDPGQCRAHLINYVDSESATQYPWNRKMLLDTAYRHLAKVCRPEEKEQVINRWVHAVPDEVAPVHTLAKFKIGSGSAEEAIPLLENALKGLPNKDATLELLTAAQLSMFKGNIDDAIKRASALAISVPDEVGGYTAMTIAVARRAMELKSFGVAMGCCDHARKLFSGTRLPTYLKAKILLKMGEAAKAGRKDIDGIRVIQQAEQVMSLVLQEDPGDRNALALLMQARAAAGKTSDALRFESLLRGMPDLDSTRFLARHWLARGSFKRVLDLTEQATRQFGDDLEMRVLAARALMAAPNSDPREVQTLLKLVYHLTRGIQDRTVREKELMLWALSKYIVMNPDNLKPGSLSELLEEFLVANESTKDLEDLAEGLAEKMPLELAFRAYSALTTDNRYKESRSGEHFVAAGHVALRMDNQIKAVEWFQAASSFDGGSDAAIEIALLKRLAGEEHEFKPEKIDSIRAACLTPDRKSAVAFLQKQLIANPENMSAQCVLAVIEDNVKLSPRIRGIAGVAKEDLVLLVALLQDNAYAATALTHVEKLREKYEDNEVLYILQARAHAQTGAFAEISKDLSAAGKSLIEDKALMAEALDILASCQDPLVRNSKIMDHLLGIVMKQDEATPPSLMATLLRYNRAVLEVPGMRRAILPRISRFWINHPKISNAGLPEAEMLVEAGNYYTALVLLRVIEKDLDESLRGDFLEIYFSTMDKLAPKAEAVVLAQMTAQAIEILEKECIHGAPLHFGLRVLDAEIYRMKGTQAGKLALSRMLKLESEYLPKHVKYFLSGADKNVDNLARTLRRLGRREGFKRGLKEVDRVLRKDPSLLPIWLLRAEWLVQLDHVDDAVVSLLWLPQYIRDTAIVDTLIQLMGRSGILVEKGKQFVLPELLEKASRFSLGMVLLRSGTYLHSAQSFELAKPHDDGTHLYYRAMALMALQDEDTEQEVRRLLVQVCEDYPDSSYAESARTVLQVF